jgi:acyl dehydratase
MPAADRPNPQSLLSRDFPVRRFAYDTARTMLYGLAVGMGRDPLDAHELAFVTEPGLKALPTMAPVIGWDDAWLSASGLDLARIVHGEQRLKLHRPLAATGEVTSTLRIEDIFDKGPERGALLFVRTEIADAADGSPVATLHSTIFARGDGGFGGPAGGPPPLRPVPDRAPDLRLALETRAEQALLYRLLGDRNPLHSDPEFARAAGYERPILHGLCTFGIAGRAVVAGLCDYAPERVAHMEGRFTAPVYPGETVVTEIWREDDGAAFRATVPARDSVVLDLGSVRLRHG